VALMIQARDRGAFRKRIGNAGKCALDETGKYPVNENDEGKSADVSIRVTSQYVLVMAGLVPAIHVFLQTCRKDVDARDKPGHDGAFADTLVRNSETYAWLTTVLPSAACAAARRAIGTR
jgi:hypothetical protein